MASSTPSPCYMPSGRISLRAGLAALLVAAAAVPSAWLYALATSDLPGFLNPLATLFYAVWLGRLAGRGIRLGQVRHPVWAGRAGAVVGVFGWYVQWAAWIALHADQSLVHASAAQSFVLFARIAQEPAHMARFAIDVAGTGTTRLLGWPVSGAPLVAAWLIELCLCLRFPASFARGEAAEVFCETCRMWASDVEVPRRFACLPAPDAARAALQADPSALQWVLRPLAQATAADADAAADGAAGHARVTLHRCACASTCLSVLNVARVATDDATAGRMLAVVVDCLYVPGTDPDALLRTWALPVQAESPLSEPRLEQAIAHLQADRHADALCLARPLTSGAPEALRADAIRVCALAASALGAWPEAAGHWDALYDIEPTPHNALQTATSLVMGGALDAGSGWYARARTMNSIVRDMPDIVLSMNFVSALTQAGHVREALPGLTEIRQAYLALRVTDATFLAVRGVPPLSAFLEDSHAAVDRALGPDAGRAWYAEMLPYLDAGGQAMLDQWLDTRYGSALHPG